MFWILEVVSARLHACTFDNRSISGLQSRHPRSLYPPQHGIAVSKGIPTIRFISSAEDNTYDALICTDVLEHVQDPLVLLADMIGKLRVEGHLVIYNCFYPLIACHLPSTFHFRYSFDLFCSLLGLCKTGKTKGDHATIYRKTGSIAPNWPLLREHETMSAIAYEANQWNELHPRATRIERSFYLMKLHPKYYAVRAKRVLRSLFFAP